MALSPRLEFRQTQSLVMTPQLMQAIKLLQFSHVDLKAYIETELEKNPLLQRADELPDQPVNGEAVINAPLENAYSESEASDAAQSNGVDGGEWIDSSLETSPQSIASTFDTDAENVFPDDAGRAGVEAAHITGRDTHQIGVSSRRDDEDYNLETFVGETLTLTDHLSNQVGLVLLDPSDHLIAHTLIDSVDSAGYFRGDLQEIADALGAELQQIEHILEQLQTLDPPGVCARSLGECLKIQLQDKNRYDPAIGALLENLELLAAREFQKLKSLCGVDQDDLVDMINEIKALNPRPGDAFDQGLAEPVVPDVIVQARPDGSWAIEMNPETLPKVLIDQTYYATVNSTLKDDSEKAYITDCFQTANWLVKSLDQRAKTILKVATEIVRQQDSFLTQGIAYLKPLNLKVIADAIGMHESTVSRVTSNKFIMTPRGIFELKYFFTSAIASSEGGDAHSAESVRFRIKKLIDDEDPKKILSDDTLVTMLKSDGIDIARRTVAKYREAMRIPSSVQRRRQKRAML